MLQQAVKERQPWLQIYENEGVAPSLLTPVSPVVMEKLKTTLLGMQPWSYMTVLPIEDKNYVGSPPLWEDEHW